jgi:hypothetical protein
MNKWEKLYMGACVTGITASAVGLYLLRKQEKPVVINLHSTVPNPNLVRESIDRALREQDRRKRRLGYS